MSSANDNQLVEEINLLLREIIRGDFNKIKEVAAPGEKGKTYSLVCILGKMLAEVSEYAAQLAQGNLSAPAPSNGNYLAVSVKNFHNKLKHLSWQIGEIAKGDYNQTIDYMGELSEGFNWMTRQLQLRKAQADYELNHDAATGLLNRKAFMRAVFDKVEEQPEKFGALLCCGLDNIKYINDTYGHEFGDQYILQAANAFKYFEPCNGVISRISGDEFAVYIHGYDTVEQAIALITGFTKEVLNKSIFVINEISQRLRSSNGLAIYPDDARAINDLVKYASYAMYEVKKSNRGSLLRFNNLNYSKKAHFFEKQEMLERLIDEKLIRFAFQPIIKLADGSIFGYEALMRSQTDKFSSPLEILQVAQEQSKLQQVERLTYEVIFQWLQENAQHLGKTKIFFNTISEYFYEKKQLEKIHKNYAQLMDNMVFEILENATNEDLFIDKIKNLRSEFGMMVAIDDYGCGYSNDFRLLNLAPNILKVDRFFIKDIQKSIDKQRIMSNILSFCKSKGIDVLAEGVETRDELKIVMQLGFDYAQGYYFAKPEFELLQVAPEKIDSIVKLHEEFIQEKNYFSMQGLS